ncbi:MAG: guanosine-5'-triphosphate,3'-diphosphate pyrophosphatase, partial [Glaciecola sp.]|nr:guanosine-5'-triphosphate,3'-diphosphate pyrophosphatase [Glaciecola sp.]
PQAITDILIQQGIRDEINLNYLYQLKTQCVEVLHIDALNVDGLAESRRAIFPSGLAILIALFESLNIQTMNIAGGALREGIIYGMLDNQTLTDRRSQSIHACIHKYHIDKQQAESVTTTAVELFKQINQNLATTILDGQSILYAAAMLHEIGLHIEFKDQHLHGAYILRYIDLPGYTKLQKQCISDLVKYHRSDVPEDAFQDYPKEVRTNLLQLLRVLRLAVVLNIKRTQDKSIYNIAQIQISEDTVTPTWNVSIEKCWLADNMLVETELANETWLMHKVNQPLNLAQY